MPFIALALTGFPIHWASHVFTGFNFLGGITVLPELIAL
jgi:general L-amino acid transport system permease protein